MPPASAYTEEATSRFAQTERWRLHYNEAGSGHPVVLLHGTGAGATGWSNFHQNVAGLAQHFRVIVPDFPGWGKSDAFDCTGEPRNTANAMAVKQLLDALNIDKAAIVGNSMGGAATLEFVANYPERISHAITMGAGLFSLPGMFSPAGLTEGLRIIFETYRDPSPENFKRLVNVMVYDSSFVTDELTKQRSDAALANPEHLRNWLKSPLIHPGGPFADLEKMLTKFQSSTVPVMMIHGRDDRTIPFEATLRTYGLFKNARAVILNQCGHWAQLEHRDEFNRLVIDFVSNAGSVA